ncbi:MAG: hypothetical protein DRI28_06585, partial [Caldiserica bacterium]
MKRGFLILTLLILCFYFLGIGNHGFSFAGDEGFPDPTPPKKVVKLVFIHHSTGEDWLNKGDLRKELNRNNYYVVETNYDWGPKDLDVNDGNPIGYHTDVGHWYNWFLGPHRDVYLSHLYNSTYTTGANSIDDPGGEAEIVMFKSCFSSLQVIYGNPDDPPLPRGENNPIYGKGCMDDWAYTVSNIKGLYRDLLDYFKTRQDKLFVIITTPPSLKEYVGDMGRLLRAINNWLVDDLFKSYPYNNVFVFDYYNVLTSNGGSPNKNDLGADTGNHHRFRNGKVEHVVNLDYHWLTYPSDSDGDGVPDDNHPTPAGHKKATYEFVPLLNIAYNRWKTGTKEVSISIKPESLDFGKVKVGENSEERTVEIENKGNVEINLNDISLTGRDKDEFLITQNDCSILDPGSLCNLKVTFSPKTEGLKHAYIESEKGNIKIPISGEGVVDESSEKGNVYYVSPDGDNSNPGTKDEPFRTPGFASKRLKPGDTLIILGGEYTLSQYWDDMITPPSGREDAWITIKGEEGNRPVLKGRNNLLAAIDIGGKSFIKIENLEITNDNDMFREGIDGLSGEVSHIILKDLYIHHVDEAGVNFADVNDLKIINCRFSHCGFGAIVGGEGNWRNVLIKDSYLGYSGHYYQGGDGSNRPYDRPDGLGVEPGDGPLQIINVICEHNFGDGLDSKLNNTTIENCIVANNSCDGVKLWGDNSKIINTLIYGRGDGDDTVTPWSPIVIDSGGKPGYHFEIINVTVDDELGHEYLMTVQYDYQDTTTYLTVRNSIFCGRGENSPIFIARGVNLTFDHNLIYNPETDHAIEYKDENYVKNELYKLGDGNIYGDPLFINPAWGEEGNYHLKKGSPAIDAGSDLNTPLADLDGIKRPQGGGIDIGCYEYVEGEISLPTSPSNLTAEATSPTEVSLSWTDNSDNEDGFKLERKQGSGP